MNGEFDRSSPYDAEIERINEIGVQAAREAMHLMCGKVIEMAYEVTDYHLQKDSEQLSHFHEHGSLKNNRIRLYVLQDQFAAPRQDKEFVKTFSVRVEPESGEDGRYMKLHIPAKDLSISEFRVPPVEDVNELYIENYDGTDSHWYAINHFGLYEYIPLIRQEEGDTILDDEGIWTWIQERIPEGVQTIQSLMRQTVNWQTVLQRDAPSDTTP